MILDNIPVEVLRQELRNVVNTCSGSHLAHIYEKTYFPKNKVIFNPKKECVEVHYKEK